MIYGAVTPPCGTDSSAALRDAPHSHAHHGGITGTCLAERRTGIFPFTATS